MIKINGFLCLIFFVACYKIIQAEKFEFIVLDSNGEVVAEGNSFDKLQELFGEDGQYSFTKFPKLEEELYKIDSKLRNENPTAYDRIVSEINTHDDYLSLMLDYYGDWLEKVAQAYDLQLVFEIKSR